MRILTYIFSLHVIFFSIFLSAIEINPPIYSLFDLKKFIIPLLDQCTEEINEGNILSLRPRNRRGFVKFVGISQDLSNIITRENSVDSENSIVPESYIVPARSLNYANRITITLDRIKSLNEKSYPVGYVRQGGTIFDQKRHLVYTQDEYYVPFFLNYNGDILHKRTNLFDGFHEIVDSKILDYGIGETISHKNQSGNITQELQITIFGGLVLPDGITTLGFFQYTYSPDTKCFYHRYFKPWTTHHLKTISNSYTQVVIRSAVLTLFKNIINLLNQQEHNLTTKEWKYLQPFLSTTEKLTDQLNQLLSVGRECRDKNWYPALYEFLQSNPKLTIKNSSVNFAL